MSTGICRWLILLITLATWTSVTNSKEMRVVCYYTNWSVYRPGTAKFSPQNINPYLCTHLIYAFGGFTKENTLKPFDKYQDIEKGGYAKFTGLKTYNKNLKTMLAIGGWNEGSSRFSPMVANPERRKELVKNAIKFLRQNHFDGLDLDWEYPSFRDGGKPRDRDNYAQLVKELREEFERESDKTGRPRLLLTMAVPAGIEYINKGYDVPKLTKYLDWMNILSYDYHSAFEPAVNHHAPLYSLEEESEYNYDTELNIDYTIKHYLKKGADPSKLVMGIPTYGRSYTLFNPDANEIGAPADGPGEMGEATRENGYLAYYEVCENVKSQDWQVVQPNDKAMGPYAFKDNQWVGYDDEGIVRKKAEYVAENSLGGIMFWAIDNDDFRGNCHGRPYPLIEAAKEALLQAYGITDDNLIAPPSKPIKSKTRTRTRTRTEETSEPPKTTASPRRRINNRNKAKEQQRESTNSRPKSRRKDQRTTETTSTYSSLKVVTPAYTTPAPPATPDQGGAFKCEDEGFYPHPKDCKKYFWCLAGAGDNGIIAHQFTCPAGLYFNKAADSCDYTQNVLCNKKLQRASSTTEKPEPKSEASTTSKPFFSTTRAPPKITAATSKTTFKFSTTTEATIEDEEEYDEEYDEEPDVKIDSEEDPRVIKELIDLIRKAGGIEELEKQLKIGDQTSSTDTTTQSAISKTLYERVLSKAAKVAANKKPLYSSLNRNSRGPQNDGLHHDEESARSSEKTRPQYSSIVRQRPSTEQPEATEEIEEEKPFKSNKKPTEQTYVNIRRQKPSTEATIEESFNRNQALGEEIDEENDRPIGSTPQYVNIRRQRPSTSQVDSSTSKYNEIRRGTTEASPHEEVSSKYKTINRRGSTTPTSLLAEEEIKTHGTTSTADLENDVTPKLLRRGSTTTSPETTSRYKTISRGTTHEAQTTEEDLTTTEVPEDTITLLTTKLTEVPSPATNKVETVQNVTILKPQLLEPRPFALPRASSTTSSPSVVPSTQANKTRLFRVGNRRRTTATRTSPKAPLTTTTAPRTASRPTKFTRRKFPTSSSTTKSLLESQVSTTRRPDSRFRFVSRRPSKLVQKQPQSDQRIESSNQQSLEEDFNTEDETGGDTTELSDIAIALQTIQTAPVPHKTSSTTQRIILQPIKTRHSTTNTPLFFTTIKPILRQKKRPSSPQAFEKINPNYNQFEQFIPLGDYSDYYDENSGSILGQIPEHSKVLLHHNGVIECLDQGNFPHPVSCKKFISCAKMENGKVLGWEYTCPKNLSFDPIGGICNWSAGLGCNEK